MMKCFDANDLPWTNCWICLQFCLTRFLTFLPSWKFCGLTPSPANEVLNTEVSGRKRNKELHQEERSAFDERARSSNDTGELSAVTEFQSARALRSSKGDARTFQLLRSLSLLWRATKLFIEGVVKWCQMKCLFW